MVTQGGSCKAGIITILGSQSNWFNIHDNIMMMCICVKYVCVLNYLQEPLSHFTQVDFSGEVNTAQWRARLLAECYYKSVEYFEIRLENFIKG